VRETAVARRAGAANTSDAAVPIPMVSGDVCHPISCAIQAAATTPG